MFGFWFWMACIALVVTYFAGAVVTDFKVYVGNCDRRCWRWPWTLFVYLIIKLPKRVHYHLTGRERRRRDYQRRHRIECLDHIPEYRNVGKQYRENGYLVSAQLTVMCIEMMTALSKSFEEDQRGSKEWPICLPLSDSEPSKLLDEVA